MPKLVGILTILAYMRTQYWPTAASQYSRLLACITGRMLLHNNSEYWQLLTDEQCSHYSTTESLVAEPILAEECGRLADRYGIIRPTTNVLLGLSFRFYAVPYKLTHAWKAIPLKQHFIIYHPYSHQHQSSG